jgi:hypothetical protein
MILRMSDDRAETASRISITRPAEDPIRRFMADRCVTIKASSENNAQSERRTRIRDFSIAESLTKHQIGNKWLFGMGCVDDRIIGNSGASAHDPNGHAEARTGVVNLRQIWASNVASAFVV